MAIPLTTDYLDRALSHLATRDDLAHLTATAKQDLHDGLAGLGESIRQDISTLQSSVDAYLKRTETWHDELTVLQARFTQMVHVLERKGIIEEQDTHLA